MELFELIQKSARYIFSSNWMFILFLMILNSASYLYKFINYRQLTTFISTLVENPTIDYNSFLYTFFLKFLFVHILYNITFFILEKRVIDSVKTMFTDIVKRLLHYNVDYFKKNNNQKIGQLWFYLSSLEVLIEKTLLELPRICIFLGYYLYTIYTFSPLAVCIIIPINVLIMYVLHPLSKRQFKLQHKRVDLDLEVKNRLLEATANIEYVKLNNQQQFETDRVLSNYDKYITNKIEDKSMTSFISAFSEIFSDMLIIIIYSIGISHVISGQLKAVDLLFLAVNTSNFYYQMCQLKEIYNYYRKIQPKVGAVYEMLIHNPIEDLDQSDRDYNELDNNNSIIFHKVSFAYQNSKPILNNVSFQFNNQQINLLLGPNGSGKSTIVKLLLRLYELDDYGIENNIIYFRGKNIKGLSLRDLRDNITVVSQDPTIFNDTVYNNIIYAARNINYSNIIRVCEMLDSKQWLNENSSKITGFRGKDISGGEKKKIQLISAICRDTDVFIFDEPSNALDSTAIKWFITFINKLKDDYKKTVIIITHDTRLVETADHIVNLQKIN